MKKQIKLWLLAAGTFPTLLLAQGTVNAAFLEFTPNAQSLGMAGTGLAVTNNGSTAIFHNPSTIAFSQELLGGTYSYSHLKSGFAMHSASLFYRMGRDGRQGFSLGYLYAKQPSLLTTDYRPYTWVLEGSYFKSVSKNLALSLTMKYLQGKGSEQSDLKRSGCLDFGMSYHKNMALLDEYASWTVGFQAANLGFKFDGNALPARLGVGGAIDLPFSLNHALQVALDLNYVMPDIYRHFQAQVGAEYTFLKYGVVRAGYHLGDKEKGTGSYGTVGCGVHYWPIRADFSYVLGKNDCLLKNSWLISLGVAL